MSGKSPATVLREALLRGERAILSQCPDGLQPLLVAELVQGLAAKLETPATLMIMARDGQRLRALQAGLAFAAPRVEALVFPAWDCQPYDRVSPSAAVVAERITTLARLAKTRASEERPRVLFTTVNAALQRVPPRARLAAETFSAAPGNAVAMDHLVAWLEGNGFLRSGTVRDVGDYAVRGGILDLFPPALAQPIRLDFFGDTLESIRAFDPETQRTTGQLRALDLVPMSEARLTTETIRRFRQGYVATFGTAPREDTLYEAVSEGRRHAGMEHWLPLFHERLDTLFDYVPGVPMLIDALAEDAAQERLTTIADHYEARRARAVESAAGKATFAGAPPYRPLPPDALYLKKAEWTERLDAAAIARVTGFAEVAPASAGLAIDCGGRIGRSFAAERARDGAQGADAGDQATCSTPPSPISARCRARASA